MKRLFDILKAIIGLPYAWLRQFVRDAAGAAADALIEEFKRPQDVERIDTNEERRRHLEDTIERWRHAGADRVRKDANTDSAGRDAGDGRGKDAGEGGD